MKYEVNFTQTACIASLAGTLLMIDCCSENKQIQGLEAAKGILGYGFILLAGAVRWKAALLMLPFGIMGIAYDVVRLYVSGKRTEFEVDIIEHQKRLIVLAVALGSAVFLSWGLHKGYTQINQELGEYVEANALREEIADYADQFPSYEEAASIYEERGIKQSWINMLYVFLTGDTNYFGSEDLSKMADLKQGSTKTVGEYIDTLKGHNMMWSTVGLLVIGIFVQRRGKNTILPLLGCIFSFIFVSLYFVYIGRFAWRVTNGCILACVISFIVMTSWSARDDLQIKLNLVSRTGITLFMILYLVISGSFIKSAQGSLIVPKAESIDHDLADTLAYMDSNSDILYLTIDSRFRYYSAYNMWAYHEPDYLDNSFSLVAHFIMGGRETLQNTGGGVYNMVEDLLEQPNIYCKYSPTRNTIFYNYIRDYYEPCVTLCVVDSYKDTKFLRYARPVLPDRIEKCAVSAVLNRSDQFLDDETVLDTISVSFDIDTIEKDYGDFYLNITDNTTGHLYSYGLKADENVCGGEIIRMKSTWGQNVLVCLVGQDRDGRYDLIADISEQFISTMSK